MPKGDKKVRGVTVEYSLYHSLEREQWEIWRTVTTYTRGISTRVVFEGTKKECKDKIENLKNELKNKDKKIEHIL